MAIPLISIIVPVYNTEKYLEQAITSVINQENPNWELILVDDGSTDKSGEICDLYAAKDKRIKVFHIENQGVSNARNLGIKNAVGEYIQFLDSDDLLEPTALNYVPENGDVDLVIYGYKRFPENVVRNAEKEILFLSFMDFQKEYINLYNNRLINYVCNKFHKRSIITNNNILFDTQFSLGEDFLFNLESIKHCNKILILPQILYNYRVEDQQGLHTRFHKDFLYINIRFKETQDSLFNYDEKIGEYTSFNFVEAMLWRITCCLHTKEIKGKEKIEVLNSWINDEYFIKNYNQAKDKLTNSGRLFKKLVERKNARAIYIVYTTRAFLSRLKQKILRR